MKIVICSFIFSLIVLSGCDSRHDDVPGYATATGPCGSILKASFDTNYHTLLVDNCVICHSESHSSLDSTIAFNSFFNYGESAVYNNAISEKHNAPFTGSFLKADFDVATTAFAVARKSFKTCVEAL